jgi:hypothetical protein
MAIRLGVKVPVRSASLPTGFVATAMMQNREDRD